MLLYVDLVFQTGEDYMIGEILRRAGYPPYEVKTPWAPYLWLFELNGRKWPENVIVGSRREEPESAEGHVFVQWERSIRKDVHYRCLVFDAQPLHHTQRV